jgi:AcrR family transcriptional regulator
MDTMSHSSGSHDARYRKTDERIISALVRLLDRKSFDDITVGDISRESGVHRSTFYQHFTDKEAVVSAVQRDFVRQVNQLDVLSDRKESDSSNPPHRHESGWPSGKRVDFLLQQILIRNHARLRRIAGIRTRYFEFEASLHQEFRKAIRDRETWLTNLECTIVADVLVDNLLDCLKQDRLVTDFFRHFYDSTLDVFIYMFQLKNNGETRRSLDAVIAQTWPIERRKERLKGQE